MGVLKFFPKPELQQDYNSADYAVMFAVWGNGNAHKGFATFYAITMRLIHARDKHPVFAHNAQEGVEVIDCKFRELEHAVLHESEYRQKDEALDVIVTGVRFYNGEHLALEGQGNG